MNKILIILVLIFSFSSSAEENCPLPTFTLPPIILQAVEVSENQCEEKFDDSFFDLATGCLSGGWKAGVSLVEGMVELTKLLLVEAPSYIWSETKKKIASIKSQDLSPFEMVQAIANIQVASHSDIFSKAQEYWNTFVDFSKDLKDSLTKEIKGFPCLSKYKQSEIICQGVSTIFLTVFTPGAFINGARWTMNSSRAVINFAKESKKIHGLEDADFATRLNKASDFLKGGRPAKDGISIGGGVLKEVELPDGQIILNFSKVVKGLDGKSHIVTREVPLDAKTKSIDANSEIGKEILAGMVSSQANKGSLIFIDINHLGKVNYFTGGTQTGDRYLSSVSESLKKSLRPGDQLFKNGGDELVVVINSSDPQVIKSISQRMIQEVDSHPEVRSVFRREVKKISEQYKALHKATSLDSLSPIMKDKLLPSEKVLAESDFKKFKEEKLTTIREEMTDQASYRGSVSIGASLIREGDDLNSTLVKAEAQASKVKAEYKLRLGHDISKYNVTPDELSEIRKWSPPQALDPN